MDWKYILSGEKNLPQDETLKKLYALSRKIKSTELDTVKSEILLSNGERHENTYSNQFFMNNFGQISFITPGCKIGQCSFCSYGAKDVKLTPKIVSEEMDKFRDAILAKKRAGQDVYAVLLDSVGSILDKNEFPPDCLQELFVKLDQLLKEVKTIESVSFETHYQTLGSYDERGEYVASDAIERLIDFKSRHGEIQTFVVELGFETANGELRDNLLFKHIDDKTYKEAVELLHKNGIEVEANVMATLPFLTQREQIEQSANSIIQALTPYAEGGYGIDSVTLFPLNVRKHTFCEYVLNAQQQCCERQNTEPPQFMRRSFPIWSMVATLNALIESGHPELLQRVSVAWFGGRGLSNDGSEVFPEDWEITYDDFVNYRKNLQGENSRVNIIKRLARHPKYLEFIDAVRAEQDCELDYHERAEYVLDLIDKMNLPIPAEKNCKIRE